MNAPNIRPSDRVAILAAVDPDAAAVGTVNSAWIDVTNWQSLMAIVMAGDLGASATLDAKLQQATSAAGAGAKDVTGKVITQLAQAGTDSDKQAIINCSQYDLDFNNGFKFVRLSMTVATATSEIAGLLLGLDPRYNAASDSDASTVDEIVG